MAKQFTVTPGRARSTLIAGLEFEVSGMLEHADLTFDQAVQHSIALSLKMISAALEELVRRETR